MRVKERLQQLARWKSDLIICLLFLVPVLALMLPSVITHFAPSYIDQMGHLYRLQYLTESVRQGNLFPRWLPYWYMGTDFIRYYPPLNTYAMLPLNLITNNPVTTYYLCAPLLTFASCVTMYALARQFTGRWGAATAALLYGLSPLFLNTWWYEGNLQRTLAAFVAPLVFLFAYRVFQTPTRLNFLALALSTMLLVLAHTMQALMTFIPLGVLLLFLGCNRGLRLADLVRTGAALALGVGLTLFWLIPSVTHIDLANVPMVYIDKLFIYSLDFSTIFNVSMFHRDPFSDKYFSVPLLAATLFGLGITVARSKKYSLPCGLLAAMLVAMTLSLGTNLGDWYLTFPIMRQFLPLRFFLAALLPASLLAGFGIQHLIYLFRAHPKWQVKAVAIALVPVILVPIYMEYAPADRRLVRAGYTSPSEGPSLLLSSYALSGRVSIAAEEGSAPAYWPTVTGGKASAIGWAIEGTIWDVTVPVLSQALRRGEDQYWQYLLSIWQVDYALLQGGQIKLYAARLAQLGFHEAERTGNPNDPTYVLLVRDSPSAPAMAQDRDVLAIGGGSAAIALRCPWVAQGQSDALEDYAPEFLAQFKSIILWEPKIKDPAVFEARVKELLSQDKQVLASPGRNIGYFAFGVSSTKEPINGTYQIHTEAGVDGSGLAQASLSFPADWRGHTYTGLNGTEMSLVQGGEAVPLLQYKLVDGHKLYFIGAAYLDLAMGLDDAASLACFNNVVGRVAPNMQVEPQFIPSSVAYGLDRMQASINMPRAGWVILSQSYNPAWKIKADGQEIPYYNFQNALCFQLPAGEHHLDMTYQMTPTQKVSFGLTLVSIAALACVLLLWAQVNRWLSFKVNVSLGVGKPTMSWAYLGRLLRSVVFKDDIEQ